MADGVSKCLGIRDASGSVAVPLFDGECFDVTESEGRYVVQLYKEFDYASCELLPQYPPVTASSGVYTGTMPTVEAQIVVFSCNSTTAEFVAGIEAAGYHGCSFDMGLEPSDAILVIGEV